MTNEQINITIAKACGWREVFLNQNSIPWGFNIGLNYSQRIPDYCNDLNAMHEAEKVLSEEVRNHYIDLLGDIYLDSWEFATATAKQRAEAFLKTIGKWEGTK